MKTIYAYTGQFPAVGYVGYINVRQHANGIAFTIRSEGENPPQAEIILTPEQCEHLAVDLLAYINADSAPGAALKPQAFGDLSGVQACCGKYAECHRPCTPRGIWAATQAAPKPLTDEQLVKFWHKAVDDRIAQLGTTYLMYARAIEAAHGIGAKEQT